MKDSQKKLNRPYVLLDIVVTATTYALAWSTVISGKVIPLDVNVGVLKPQVYPMAPIFIVPIYLILYANFHLYVPKRTQGRHSEFANICKANIIGLIIFIFVLFGVRRFIQHNEFPSTKILLAFFAISIIPMETERICIRLFLHSLQISEYNQKYVLLTRYSRAVEEFIDRVSINPEQGYHVQGILDDNQKPDYRYRNVQVLGLMDHLEAFLASNTLNEIAITLSIKKYANLEPIMAACEKPGVHTKFISDYNNIIPTTPYMEDLQGLPVIHIRYVPLTGVFNATMGRIVDTIGALPGLIVFSPVMVLTAVLIRITSPGPVIFSQERIGLHNHPSGMYRFRSMGVQDPGKGRGQWTTPHDPRVTSMGRFIRKIGINETPQFFNILVGDTSLVGLRPGRSLFVEEFEEGIPRYIIKHRVCPGLTGWIQVNGYRGDTSIIKRIGHDLYHIENWSLGFDFKIMSLTISRGFTNKNVY